MAQPEKVIVTCAITGSIHTPTMSPHLPVSPSQIAEQAIAAAEAGAAILHLHARDPETGEPSSDPEVFGQFLPQIARHCDAVLNVSTGGGANMSVDHRLRAARALSPEMCSLNMGTMNFGTFPMAARFDEWAHAWEEPFLQSTRDFVFKNTFADIEAILSEIGGGHGTRFEFECYDAGHVQTLAHYLRRQEVSAPLFVQFVMGVLGGIDAHPEQLLHLKRTADRLLGKSFRFSVLGAGRHQMPLATVSAVLGGHVRVGLEDSLMIGPGKLAESNAAQVTKIRGILERLDRPLATPADARQMLALKGAHRVAF